LGSVTAFEAKTRFGKLLDRVSRGEEITLTKYGKSVALLIPEGRPALKQVREAVSELQALRQRMAKRRGFRPLSDKEIREAIEKGRP